jgi:hypothetical protein
MLRIVEDFLVIAASPGAMLPDCDVATAGWPLLFNGVHVLFLFSISDH